MDFIEANLSQELHLAQIADLANFSRFHFHRIFAALTGEPLNQFVARVRIERAAVMLVRQPERTISAIGADCGFGTPSAFSRAFKSTYDMTPGRWRSSRKHNLLQVDAPATGPRLSSGEAMERSLTIAEVRAGVEWSLACPGLAPATVTLETTDAVGVAYVRHTGQYQGSSAIFADLFQRITQWAQQAGIETEATLALYHDDPELTSDEQLRVSACVVIPDDVDPLPPVGRTTLRAGTYAVGRFVLRDTDYSIAWRALLGAWLPSSGYEPDDRICHERFPIESLPSSLGRPVEIWIPVRPLRT